MSVIRGKVINSREVVPSTVSVGGWGRVVKEENGKLVAVDKASILDNKGTLKNFLQSSSSSPTTINQGQTRRAGR